MGPQLGASTLRVAVRNMGCRLNRVELDVMAAGFEEAGCALVAEDEADVVVINTCAVTGEAEAKCRKAVRHAAALPQQPLVVATGCVANLFSGELLELGPNVQVVSDKGSLVSHVLAERAEAAGTEACGLRAETPTPTGRLRPGIKIQDGCDNRCTFCIVWKARGASRSVAPERILDEVRAAQARGAHEVVLSGINLGSYRWDGGECGRGADMRLPELLSLILEKTDVERVRLSSIEPPDVTADLARVMGEAGGRVAPFLHVCLQAGCDRTLRRMARVYDTALYRERVEQARAAVPELALGCDLIVGFPGETDEDFEESLAFCREMRFAKMHVFRYSKRPSTPAATMPDQVAPQVMAERSARMRALADELRHACAAELVGRDEQVLVQYPGRAVTGGLFDVLVDPGLPLNDFVRVRPHAILPNSTLDARP